MSLIHHLSKPEYMLRPSQIGRRIIGLLVRRTQLQRVRLPWGMYVWVDPVEAIGRAIVKAGVFELVVTETLWRLADPGDLAVDVGANIGYMSSVMALRCGPAGSVWLFEPHAGNFRSLERNLEVWRADRRCSPFVEFPTALGDAEGFVDVIEPAGFKENRGRAMVGETIIASNTLNRKSTLAAISRLDDVFESKTVSLVKIDVEGAELRVLHGAQKLLEGGRIRDILFEDFGATPSPAMVYLAKFGYRIFALRKTFWGPRLDSWDTRVPAVPWETPNYLATLEADRARVRMARRGWECLRGENIRQPSNS